MRFLLLIALLSAGAVERRETRMVPLPSECRFRYEQLGLVAPLRPWQETGPRKVVWEEDYRELRRFTNPGNVDPYEAHKKDRIVFLADGDDASLADAVAARFPDARVTKGDYALVGTETSGNLTRRFIDNTKELGPAGGADLVVMRKGLCLCKGPACCGGVRPTPHAMSDFFGRVGRLLDRGNPNAKALLHGEGVNEVPWPIWTVAAEVAMAREAGLHIELIRDTNGKFAGARLTWHSGN